MFTQSERYRRLSRPLAKAERDLDTEHRAIADAALARDADKCTALMDEHIGSTTRILIEAGVQEVEHALDLKQRVGEESTLRGRPRRRAEAART